MCNERNRMQDLDDAYLQMIEDSIPPHPFDIEGEGAVKITVKQDYVDPDTGEEYFAAYAEAPHLYVEVEFPYSGRPSDEAIREALRDQFDADCELPK